MKPQAILLSILGLLAGCSKPPPKPAYKAPQKASSEVELRKDSVETLASRNSDAAVPEIYKRLFEGAIRTRDSYTVVEAFPYESISFEGVEARDIRDIPVHFRVTFSKSLTAELRTESGFPERIGEFVGEIELYDYGKLCYTLDRLRFQDFNEIYDPKWMHAMKYVVTVTTSRGSKQVIDYGENGPIELWIVEQVICSLRNQIQWKPKP